MIHAQNSKAVNVILPQSIGTTVVTGVLDTLGYDYASVEFVKDTAVASSVVTTMKLTEGDTTSAYSAIAKFTNGTATGNFVPAVPSTSGTGQIHKFHVDLRKRKRHLLVSLASTTARLCAVKAELSRGKMPASDTEAGCAEIVYG